MKKKIDIRSALKKSFRSQQKAGKAPGSVIYQGLRNTGVFSVQLIKYNSESYAEVDIPDLQNCSAAIEPGKVNWVNIQGLSKEDEIEKLGKQFGLNPLLLEDTVNTGSRPKIDEYDNCIFMVLKMIYLDDEYHTITEHIALVLMEDVLLLFQEVEMDVFDPVRARLSNKLGKIRDRGADYLFYVLMDAVIDQYFIVLENVYDKIEALENRVFSDSNSDKDTVNEIQLLKKEVMQIRKYIRPVKELVGHLLKTEHTLVKPDTKLFLRDAYDHITQIAENTEMYLEMAMNLMDVHMSNVSNKMNEVMKVLTIMASIFIPLTFIAGVYGMNFRNMPELNSPYGYYIVWGIMILVFVIMILYFKRKRWL
ncbi:magnesium/cobalt transporter CorA [Robertkochia solimangrovi]|uniref:magnesium/cobalt transporter CorA n=1 Tax=Robertkochia solimangrovi TaxID=2213046 RepID=UPI00117D23C9|nr:magnesium/cobalt transporter CorA [Robertkochia solimangrovi]TRZ45246.1 magnesium and cobalt transport protein CorA [Robertkochia solimangrovi]